MQESKWWSKLFLVSSGLAIVLLLAAPLGYKYGIAELLPSFATLLLALATALLVIIGGLVMAVIAHRRSLVRERNQISIAMVISLIPLLVMAPPIMKGRSVPPIHDITTDVSEPPAFDVVIGLRAEALNPLEYGAGQDSPAALAKLQQDAYPQLKPLVSSLPPGEAIARAVAVLEEMGLEVVNVDPQAGRVEAVATTFWFGFKDDLVVRVRPTDDGSQLDVRSISRVGQSDLGANAARIEAFQQAFSAQ